MDSLFPIIELLRDDEPHGAALNMAVDEWLLRHAALPVLRVYRWARPAMSFGYFMRFAEIEPMLDGREPMRRWTGGGIVEHGADWTYSLIVPASEKFARSPAAGSYAAIHALLAEALRCAGIEARISSGANRSAGGACFQNPVEHDVLVDGRKVAGAAQRRSQLGMLHQGSVLGVKLPADFDARLAAAVAVTFSARAMRDDELRGAGEIAELRYATDAWLRRF